MTDIGTGFRTIISKSHKNNLTTPYQNRHTTQAC